MNIEGSRIDFNRKDQLFKFAGIYQTRWRVE